MTMVRLGIAAGLALPAAMHNSNEVLSKRC